MAGAWEKINQQRVLVVILTREIVSTAWAFGFKNLQIPNGTYTGLSGMPFAMARNTGCQKLLELGWEFCCFVDDDTIPPPDAIIKLTAHNLPIVSGLYYRRNPPIVPVMLKNTAGGRQWVTEFKVPDLLEVDYVGAGCLLIKKEVLLALPPISPRDHWFEWNVNSYDLPEKERMSEDFKFCDHARAHGFRIYVDTSVQCRHIGYGESRVGGQFVPAELLLS